MKDLEGSVLAFTRNNKDLMAFARKLSSHVYSLHVEDEVLNITFFNMASVKIKYNFFSDYSATFNFSSMQESRVKPELLSYREKMSGNMSLDRLIYVLSQYCYPDGWYNEKANAMTSQLRK